VASESSAASDSCGSPTCPAMRCLNRRAIACALIRSHKIDMCLSVLTNHVCVWGGVCSPSPSAERVAHRGATRTPRSRRRHDGDLHGLDAAGRSPDDTVRDARARRFLIAISITDRRMVGSGARAIRRDTRTARRHRNVPEVFATGSAAIRWSVRRSISLKPSHPIALAGFTIPWVV